MDLRLVWDQLLLDLHLPEPFMFVKHDPVRISHLLPALDLANRMNHLTLVLPYVQTDMLTIVLLLDNRPSSVMSQLYRVAERVDVEHLIALDLLTDYRSYAEC